MNVTRSFAVAATFAAVAVGAAAPASAAPEMSGHYIATETAANGRSTTNHWYFAPCGDGCASVAPKVQRLLGGRSWLADNGYLISQVRPQCVRTIPRFPMLSPRTTRGTKAPWLAQCRQPLTRQNAAIRQATR